MSAPYTIVIVFAYVCQKIMKYARDLTKF